MCNGSIKNNTSEVNFTATRLTLPSGVWLGLSSKLYKVVEVVSPFDYFLP